MKKIEDKIYSYIKNNELEIEKIMKNYNNYIFTIKTIDQKEELKSFTYSDILIENLEIINKGE